MKKIIAGLLIVFSANTFAASSSDVIGGVIGGIVLGKILTDNEHQHRAPPPPPVYVPAPQYPMCPYPYAPVYDTVWVIDQYNRNIPVQRFVGCR